MNELIITFDVNLDRYPLIDCSADDSVIVINHVNETIDLVDYTSDCSIFPIPNNLSSEQIARIIAQYKRHFEELHRLYRTNDVLYINYLNDLLNNFYAADFDIKL